MSEHTYRLPGNFQHLGHHLYQVYQGAMGGAEAIGGVPRNLARDHGGKLLFQRHKGMMSHKGSISWWFDSLRQHDQIRFHFSGFLLRASRDDGANTISPCLDMHKVTSIIYKQTNKQMHKVATMYHPISSAKVTNKGFTRGDTRGDFEHGGDFGEA